MVQNFGIIIGGETDPRVIWTNIEQFRNSTRESNPIVIRQRLYTERMGSTTAQQFLNKVMTYRRDLINCGGQVSDEEVIAVLIAGLPHKNVTDDFHNLVSRLKQSLITDPDNTTLATVIESILARDSEVQTLREMNGEASNSNTAMLARASRNPRGNPLQNSFRNRRISQGNSRTGNRQQNENCWYCDNPGHFKDECNEFFEYLMRNLQSHRRYNRQYNANRPTINPNRFQNPSESQLNELTVDKEDEEFLDAIEQQLDTPIQTDHPAELNVLTNDDHHAQGW